MSNVEIYIAGPDIFTPNVLPHVKKPGVQEFLDKVIQDMVKLGVTDLKVIRK